MWLKEMRKCPKCGCYLEQQPRGTWECPLCDYTEEN